MNLPAQIDKYKDKLINAVIIIVALIFATNIYKDYAAKINTMKSKISEAAKKNEELEKISQMDRKINAFRGLLTEKEKGVVISSITDIAKATGVDLLSVKPSDKEVGDDYVKDLFDVAINAPNYNILAKFVNAVETYKNFYIIEGITVVPQEKNDKMILTVNLHLSSVSANTTKAKK